MAGLTWNPPLMRITENIKAYGVKAEKAAASIVDSKAAVIAPEMKGTHPWRNRTGEAEAKLYSEAAHSEGLHVLRFGGKAEHQQYLEWRWDWNGRWAVVRPTYDKYRKLIAAEIRSTFGK